MRYFEFVHNLGLHAWDIPALVAGDFSNYDYCAS